MKTLYLTLDQGIIDSGREQMLYSISKFPGGEMNIKLTSKVIEKCDVVIAQRIKNADDVMAILMAVNALRQQGFKKFVNKISLFIPYLPYARQDRVCNKGEAASLEVFTSLINSCNFDNVWVFDCHSDVGPALLNNCINFSNHNFIYNVVENMLEGITEKHPRIGIVAPDDGAVKKIHKVTQMLSNAFPDVEFKLITCSKNRDLSTGEITETIVNNASYVFQHCLIIDDICDSGGTMIEVAKVLHERGATDISLAVSHGIFSKGFAVFENRFKNIYTTLSFKTFKFNQPHGEYEFKVDSIKILSIT